MATLDVTEIDLEALARSLADKCPVAPEGPVVGRTVIRDLVLAELACSQLEAELLVDTMISRGFARLTSSVDGRQIWQFFAEG